MKTMKKLSAGFLALLFTLISTISPVFAAEEDEKTEEIAPITYLQAVANTDEAVEMQKSSIFDASQSYIPDADRDIQYDWDFGDGNKNEGVEVLHAYNDPGKHTVILTITDGVETSTIEKEIFAYRKLITLLTDQSEAQERITLIKDFAEKKGVFIKVIESFGSSTEFISEEVLNKKLTEESGILQKSQEIVVWTKENAGLNALSRFIQGNAKKDINFGQKTITIITETISTTSNRIQRQFELINPKDIIVAKEGIIYPLIEGQNEDEFIETLEKGGYEYVRIDAKTGKLRPWNFMSYFVNFLVNQGVPDNTIALLLLLPVIATVVAVMKQLVGVTTFGIYTPSIITLSFLVIGLYAGLLTLLAAVLIGALSLPLLKKVRMLFIPKMAIVISVVSLVLFGILIFSTSIGLFDAQFLSIAIFPMLILSTLVEKFISVKTEKGLSSAAILMSETVIVAIIAYFIAGGEINLGFAVLKMDFVKNMMMNYPEIIFLLLIVNFFLGKWSGVRLLELIRFREVLRHIEE